MSAWYAAPLALLVGALALTINRRWLGFLPEDPPSLPRKRHGRSMPQAGVLLLPLSLPWLLPHAANWLEPAALTLAAAVGYADDLAKERGQGLPWPCKAILLLGAAMLAAAAHLPPAASAGQWAWAVGLLFVLINAVNFLDNCNGVALALAAAALLVAPGSTAHVAIGWLALGLLPLNWPRAQMFLGDAGAYFLGTACGLAALRAPQFPQPSALLPVAIPLCDFTQVVFARLCLCLPPWVGDRRHLTHLLLHRGVPAWLLAPLFGGAAWAIASLPRGWLATH